MIKIIPFVTQEDSITTQKWLNCFKEELKDFDIVLFEELSKEELLKAQVAIVANPNPNDLYMMPNLKWVQSLWAGVEKLVMQLENFNFEIVRMVDKQLSQTMAQSVLAWSMYLYKDMPLYYKQQKNSIWKQQELQLIEDTKILVLGLGNLGEASAIKLSQNGFNVSGWSKNKKEITGVKTYHSQSSLYEIIKDFDIVVCLLPLTNETKNIIDKKMLLNMKKGVKIINFARSAIFDYSALIDALNKNHVSHAVLDVFEQEPLEKDSIFWIHDDVTVLPHISAPTNIKSATKIIKDNLSKYFEMGIIPKSVNKSKGY